MTGLAADPPTVLREYAVLADGYRAAVTGPRGQIVWMCFPVWHDPAVFASLLGSGGMFTVRPSAPFVWGGYYEAGSLIWRSRWITQGGIVESREALALPADRDRAVIMRRICALEGDAVVDVSLQPAADYGRSTAGTWSRRGARRRWLEAHGQLSYLLSGVNSERVSPKGLRAELAISEGHHRDLVLQINGPEVDPIDVDPDTLWNDTVHHWRIGDVECPDPAAERDVRHAFAVLRGLTAPTGGTVAAVTVSLPEQADTGRSYDYRYVWIRDLCYIASAAAAAGAADVVGSAARFVIDRLLADGDNLMPAYTIDGEPVPRPRHLQLPGYPGGADTVGNGVQDQFQLDVFGEALTLLAAADTVGRLDADGWAAAQAAAGAIERRWQEPDSGIWELDTHHWTHSRLVCAAGLRAIADRPGGAPWRTGWSAIADRIVATAAEQATHPTGRWQRAPDDDRVDASLLVPGLRGAVPPNDPRHVATYRAVGDELCSDGYVYRFRHHQGLALGDAEGAFLLCSFWMCLAALGQGDHVAAARWFERGRAGSGSPGLFAEEFDVEERQLRGNLPQAFVHGLLIEAAYTLYEATGP